MSETPNVDYDSINDSNNNNLKIDEVISEAEKDDIITSEELQEIYTSKNKEKEILSKESLDKISNYEKEISLSLLKNNMKIPDRCIADEGAFKEFLRNVSIMSGINTSDRISFNDLDIESTNYLKIGPDGNIEFTIRVGENSFDIEDKFDTDEILHKFEGLSENNYDYINQTEGLTLKNGVVTHTYTLNGVIYSNYFTVSKNPNTSKNLGTDNENKISRLGQSQSLKQWTEATVYLRKDQLAKKQIEGTNDKETETETETQVQTQKETAPQDISPVMNFKENIKDNHVNEETSFQEPVSETFDNAVDSTVETYNDVKETVLETYEESVQWLREYFKEFPDAGKIDLGNGEFLEVEYDSKNNKLYVDTQFFDGISDYKSEVELKDIANTTPDDLRELISQKNAEFLAEYNTAIEKKEINRSIKDILSPSTNRKMISETRSIDSIDIGGYSFDVKLTRDSKGNINANLYSNSGKETSILVAKKGDEISLQGTKIIAVGDKSISINDLLKEEYTKNNPEKKAA